MKIIIEDNCPDYERIEPDIFTPLVEKVLWVNLSKFAFPEYMGTRHLHHFHQMDIILDGEFKLILESVKKAIGHAGDAWIVPPLMWHRIESPKPYNLCSIKFHLTPRYWSLLGNTFHQFRISKEARQYITLCSQGWKQNSTWASQQITDVLSLCLVEFLDMSPQVSAEEDSLNEFRHMLWPLLQIVLREPNVKWTVARMAEEMGLSADYFSRCFRSVIGQTPQRYIMEATMRTAAASLLNNPSLPIKQIAESAGYGNVHTFTRAFTQVSKISPAAYRREAARGM